MKNQKNLTNKIHSKRRTATILIFLMLTIVILSINFASATNWDNKLNYEDNDMKVKFKNIFGWGKDLGTAELKSHKSVDEILEFGFGQEEVVMYYDFSNWELYRNGLGEVYFTDMITGELIEKDYYFVEWKEIEVDVLDRKVICEPNFINGTKGICNNVVIGNHKEMQFDWVRYDSTDIPNKNIRIGIKTSVNDGDYIDGVWTIAGKKISKHSEWVGGVNVNMVAYYEFEETSGEVIDSLSGLHNGITSNASRGAIGKVNNAFAFNDASDTVIVNDSSALNLTTNAAFSVWININGTIGSTSILGKKKPDPNNYELFLSTNQLAFYVGGSPTYYDFTLLSQTWYHIVINVNATGSWLYVNGIFNESNGITLGVVVPHNLEIGRNVNIDAAIGIYDEMGIWNRTLSTEEITFIYNSGDGRKFISNYAPPQVTLNSPTNNTNSTLNTITFNCSASDDVNLVNVSLMLDGVVNETNTTGINDTFYIFTKTLAEGAYNWSCRAADNNSQITTAGQRLVNVSRIFLESESFTSSVTEGSSSIFTATFLTNGSDITLANLSYNGTQNIATIVENSENNFTVTQVIVAPSVLVDTNFSFFWNITQAGGFFNDFATQNQTVLNLGIDDCSSFTTLIFNYTVFDEDNQTKLDSATVDSQLDISFLAFATTDVLFNFSKLYNKTNPIEVCFESNLTNGTVYSINSVIKYEASDHVIEYYNIHNFTLQNTSIPQEINLFDLLSTDSTEFQVTFKDSSFIVVEGALVQISRQYISEGQFKVVEIPQTDSNGQTVVHLVEKDIVYNVLITKNGEILGTFNNVIAFCEDSTIGLCQLNLNAFTEGTSSFSYDDEIGIFSTLTYNQTSRVINLIFSTADGGTKKVNLVGNLLDLLGNTTVCNETLTSASGQLTCSIPKSIGNSSVFIEIIVNDDKKLNSVVRLLDDAPYGTSGYLIMFIMVITLPLMFSQSKTLIVLAVIIGLIFSSLFSIYKGGILGGGSAIIWIIIAGMILIWRLNKGERT